MNGLQLTKPFLSTYVLAVCTSDARESREMDLMTFVHALAAALGAFALGGVWYSPLLFQKQWMRANNLTDSDLAKGGTASIFGLTFALSLVMAASLAAFLDAPDTTMAWGATAGLLTGVTWVAPSLAT